MLKLEQPAQTSPRTKLKRFPKEDWSDRKNGGCGVLSSNLKSYRLKQNARAKRCLGDRKSVLMLLRGLWFLIYGLK